MITVLEGWTCPSDCNVRLRRIECIVTTLKQMKVYCRTCIEKCHPIKITVKRSKKKCNIKNRKQSEI